MIFNGIIFGTYSSGNIQFRWKISNGLLDGISVGFFDSTKDNIRYIYNYERGKKQGDQYEYYLCEEAVPNYSFDDSTIHDFDKTFFGNLDNNFSIDFYQSDGCRIKTDSVTRESIYPSRSDCPTGQLHVFYYAHPGPGELFTKCYGISKCFWRSFKRGNTWWFD
jgi:hypothetical protein